MAFILDDRCRETSTAPGTGSFTMNGAVQGAQTFASALTSNADTTWYAATNGTAWETGLLTRTSATVFARTTIFRSTNGNAAVNFSTGAIDVFCDVPGSKAKVLERLLWAAAAITPPANDGTALGTGALAFSDLFLASGGVLNFNNGNYTATHSTGALDLSGDLTWGGLAGTAYTPTITATTGTFTTVSASGTWKKFGKYVFWRLLITVTTLGSASGRITVPVPTGNVAGTSGFAAICHGWRNDKKAVHGNVVGSTTSVDVVLYDATFPVAGADNLTIQGWYELS
jgi:hypothetical protein